MDNMEETQVAKQRKAKATPAGYSWLPAFRMVYGEDAPLPERLTPAFLQDLAWRAATMEASQAKAHSALRRCD
ncbi:unnamed protein product, partial [Durusdinium trenchii]